MCAHAYALTRRGAALLLEQWEPCGLAVDAQWHALERRGLLRWTRMHAESFNGTAEFSFLSEPPQRSPSRAKQGQGTRGAGDGSASGSADQSFFRGMFKQGNLGSFNDHRWMPNAGADAAAATEANASE
jgi:hypothetical protein